MKQKFLLLTLVLVTVSLGACLRPYQQDIQQGNLLTNDNLSRLKLGMSQREVEFLLGTPMVADPFHTDRWDYFYSYKTTKTRDTEVRQLSVFFTLGELSKLQGYVTLGELDTLPPSEEDLHVGGTVVTRPTQKRYGLFERAADALRDDD
ncbi:MAG: outer membrane protein assembly factor BamE [Proteobacteria bacterium]|jgi:outer membrane protein assembly factor BamE|nr:outer membrane protein assembly factor BamE [Pseudomonadota bacterium]